MQSSLPVLHFLWQLAFCVWVLGGILVLNFNRRTRNAFLFVFSILESCVTVTGVSGRILRTGVLTTATTTMGLSGLPTDVYIPAAGQERFRLVKN